MRTCDTKIGVAGSLCLPISISVLQNNLMPQRISQRFTESTRNHFCSTYTATFRGELSAAFDACICHVPNTIQLFSSFSVYRL